jgi:exodeoxyribonuclease VII large subunit
LQGPDHHPQHRIYSITRLTEEIKQLLEEKYPFIWISGEISNFRKPSSGHAYFTLKDSKAQIAGVMFAGQLRRVAFDLEDGLQIVGMGRVTVYGPRGNYQVILEHVQPKGAGALQIAFEQLKRKLEAEGLFDSRNKSTLPLLPRKLAVITSTSGAVLQDFLNIAGRRYPNLYTLILPVRVQGETSAREIATAISRANSLGPDAPDVIVLARGGGSIEDLAAYNSEMVARAIFDSSIPVVSAVGHETDYTIADFVADLRAPTPSAAAELVVPVKNELKNKCVQLGQRCWSLIDHVLRARRNSVSGMQRALIHPRRRIQENQQRLDDLNHRLGRVVQNCRDRAQHRYEKAIQGLGYNKPDRTIGKSKSGIAMLAARLDQSIHLKLGASREQLRLFNASLRALNPQAILKRGYSITRTLPRKQIVTDAACLDAGQSLDIQFSKGNAVVTVNGKTP